MNVMIVSMRKFSEWIPRCDLMRPEVIGFETVVIDFHLSRMAAAKLREELWAANVGVPFAEEMVRGQRVEGAIVRRRVMMWRTCCREVH